MVAALMADLPPHDLQVPYQSLQHDDFALALLGLVPPGIDSECEQDARHDGCTLREHPVPCDRLIPVRHLC